MTTLRYAARRQLEEFLSALFLADELIEIRFIESWAFRGRKKSRVARSAQWLRPHELISQYDEITDFARREWANIYFGVCPRSQKGDSHDQAIEFGSKGMQINRDFSASVRLSHHRHRLVRTDVQCGVDGNGGNRADVQARFCGQVSSASVTCLFSIAAGTVSRQT